MWSHWLCTGSTSKVTAKDKRRPLHMGCAHGGHCCETPSRARQRNCQSSSDSNYLLYIYTLLWHKISISTPVLWAVWGILLNCGTTRSSRGHCYRADWILSPPVIKNWWQNSTYLDKQQSLGKFKAFRSNFTLFLICRNDMQALM